MPSRPDLRPFTHHTPPRVPLSTLPMPGESTIVIPLPCIPRYKRGSGPPLQRITLQPVDDSTAYIVERIFLPPKGVGRDGRPLPKRPGYIIGWTDLPAARTVVTARDVLTYVSPRKLEEWECSFEEELNAGRRELQAAKEGRAGIPDQSGKRKKGRPPKHAHIESAAAVVDEDSDQLAGAAMAVGGGMLSTPTKKGRTLLSESMWEDEQSGEGAGFTTEETDGLRRNDVLPAEQADYDNDGDEEEEWQGFSNEPTVLEEPVGHLGDVGMEGGIATITGVEENLAGQQGAGDESEEEDEELTTRELARELYRRGVAAMSNSADPDGTHDQQTHVQRDEDDAMAEFFDAPENISDQDVRIKREPVATDWEFEQPEIDTLPSVETTQARRTPADTSGTATSGQSTHQLSYPQWVAIGSRRESLRRESSRRESSRRESSRSHEMPELAAQSTAQPLTSPMLHQHPAENGPSCKSKPRGSLNYETPIQKSTSKKLPKPSPSSRASSRGKKKTTPRARSGSAAHTPVLVNGSEEWVVKDIEDDETYQVEGRGLVRYFLVRWEGDWPPDQNPSWEPEENLPAQLVKNYFKKDMSRLTPAARKRRRDRALLRASGSTHFGSVGEAFAGELADMDTALQNHNGNFQDVGNSSNGGIGADGHGEAHDYEQDELIAVDDGPPPELKRPRLSFGPSRGVVVGPWGGSKI